MNLGPGSNETLLFLKSYDRNINQSSFMNRKMILIDETLPVDGDFMLFLLISGGRLLDLGICRGNPLCSCESLSSIIQRRVITY